MMPQYIPAAMLPQQFAIVNGYMQPVTAGFPQGYQGNAFPTPYIANQYPVGMQNPIAPMMQNQFNPPYAQPMHAQITGTPSVQSHFNHNAIQPTPYYQPAINISDGQFTLLPSQYPPGTTRNVSPLSKNGERDFISWFPNVNILETDRSFKIEVCVPGVARENCRINIDKNNILRITGTRRWNQETDAVGFTRKDFNYGSFACSFLLPEHLQKEKISSSCRNGILIINIPKHELNETDDRTYSEISVN
jgi:HSP20 family protein